MKIWLFRKVINNNFGDVDQGRKKTQITKIRNKIGKITTTLEK